VKGVLILISADIPPSDLNLASAVIAVSHEGKLTNFKCHAEIARGKQDMLSGDIKFAIKPTIDIMVAAQTPFNGYKNVKASVSHQATDMKIKSHAEITYFKKDVKGVLILISADIPPSDLNLASAVILLLLLVARFILVLKSDSEPV
jgi:hypothetical protein